MSSEGKHTDVLVIGGGPAGTSAAIALSKFHIKTTVLEKTDYSGMRIGETLPPKVKLPLEALGIWEQFQADGHSNSDGIISVWGSDIQHNNNFIFNPYGSGWHIDRNRFDKMLASAAERAGAPVHKSTRVISKRRCSAGAWKIDAICEGRLVHFESDFLVEAGGRTVSSSSETNAARIVYDRLVAVIAFLEIENPNLSHDTRTMIESSPDGWWYSAVLPENLLVVAFMTGGDLIPKHPQVLATDWKTKLSRSAHTQARVAQCRTGSEPLALSLKAAQSYRRSRVSAPNYLAIGDIASAFDPLYGQGIYRALENGISAGLVIEGHRRGDDFALAAYEDEIMNIYADYLQGRTEYYQREQRWSDLAFWKRRHNPSYLTPPPVVS